MSGYKKDSDTDDVESMHPIRTENPSRLDQDIPFCGCLSVKYYAPYFDVDTIEVVDRISNAVLYCRREQNFLAYIGEKPDAYGPFWIATTLVFIVSVSSHVNGWFSSWMKGNVMAYNFQSVVSAASVIYGFSSIAPLLIWGVFRTYEPKLKFVTILCLYGYSLFVFIPGVLLCTIPSQLGAWISLLITAVISGIFLLRNLAPFIVVHAKKQAAVLLSFVGFIQLALMMTLKIYFFYNA
eukprot:gene12221-16371_t